jgi:hypothetical protein
LFSYVVAFDVGFAPNPFHDVCTLATCKPQIRRTAKIGDWVIGTGSKPKGLEGRLVYAMKVDEILSYEAYWLDPRFASKRPNLRGSLKQRYGDNIYHPDAAGDWVQENSRHSLPDGTPNTGHVTRDTGANAVLLAQEFVYFGGHGPVIPDYLRHGFGVDLCQGGRGYRVMFPSGMPEAVADWVTSDLPAYVQGDPFDWKSGRRG